MESRSRLLCILRGNASLSGFLYKNYYNDNNNQSRSAATWLPISVCFLSRVKISQFNYIFSFVSIIVLKPNSTGSLLVKCFVYFCFVPREACIPGWLNLDAAVGSAFGYPVYSLL